MAPHEPAVQALCEHHGEDDPEALIIRLCQELLSHQPTESGATPLDVLGSYRCIRRVHRGPLDVATGCSGLLVPDDGGYVVMLDERQTPGRQHRSHGHETTHTFFREVHLGPPGREEERLCEVGATELTMPADRAAALMTNRPNVTFDFITQFAGKFNVSKAAAARRVVELSLSPVCYLVATISRTRNQVALDCGDPMLRIASWATSRSWPDRRPYLGLAIDPDLLVGQAFEAHDLRSGWGDPGIDHRDGTFEIEAAGFEFVQRGARMQQVVVLLRG